MVKHAKNTICLWFDGTAEEAARFYADTFPDSAVKAVHRAPGDYPAGKEGDVLTVEFTVLGVSCLGLNGGPAFKHTEAFSFQVATADQAETDRYWDAIVGNGGKESACGWCKDRWGLSWQITPVALTKAITDPDPAAAKRAFDAMMTMRKIDVAAIEAAVRGSGGHPNGSATTSLTLGRSKPMKWNPHLTFDGRCKEAFEFYETCLGGKVVAMVGYADMTGTQDVPAALRGRVMHARLVRGDQVLMGSDAHPGMGPYEGIKACDVAVRVETPAEAERLFAALAEGGAVQMPLGETSWSARFGMVTDKFGVPWMVNCESAAGA